MKEEKVLLEGIYAMLEKMQEKPNCPKVSQITPTVDLSGIEMFLKHWKTQSVEQSIYIEKTIVEKLENIAVNSNQTSNSDEKLDRIIEILQQPLAKPHPQKHHHIIDLKSSKTVKYILIQWLLIFLFLGWSIWLADTNMKLRDNDLKYRYIKSENPNNAFIQHLEKVFNYERDRKTIRNIRKTVRKHENEVKKRAESIEAGNLND